MNLHALRGGVDGDTPVFSGCARGGNRSIITLQAGQKRDAA